MDESPILVSNYTSDATRSTFISVTSLQSLATNRSQQMTVTTTTSNSQIITESAMWFQISITLIVVVLVCLVIFLVLFCRQRRLLNKALTRTFRRSLSSSAHVNTYSDKLSITGREKDCAIECDYSNSGFDESGERVQYVYEAIVTKTEDVGSQVTDGPISNRKDANTESGFESFPGSILDRRRNVNLYESGLGSMSGSVHENSHSKLEHEDQYAVVHETHTVFQHHRRISEEDTEKEEAEIQKREKILTTDNHDNLSESRNKDVNNIIRKDVNRVSEEDYENVLEAISETPNLFLEDDQSLLNVENPTYGFVSYDKSNSQENLLEKTEELKDSASSIEKSGLYQNTGSLRDEYLSKLQSLPPTSGRNFLDLEWDYKCTVDINGGLIKAPNSDISLFLPANFITHAPATTIVWSIFAQDCEIKAKTELESFIVSPVVEYFTPYKDAFDEYVIIELPHCISEHADDIVQPYWFHPTSSALNGKYQINEIQRFNEEDFDENNTFPDVFFVKSKAGFVSIYTTHFSVYFCACSQSFPLELYAVTFGKYVPIDSSQGNIKLKVHIADAKINLKDYLEVLKKEEQSIGYTYKGKTEIDLDEEITGTDCIEIKVDFEDVPRNMNPVWNHSVDKEGYPIHPVSKSWPVSNRFKCDSHKFIQTTKEWQFKNESPPRLITVFQCFIEILYRKVVGQDCKKDNDSPNNSLDATLNTDFTTKDYNAMGPYGVEHMERQQHSTALKSPSITTSQNSRCIRTRMTVDIDLQDTVIEIDNIDPLGSLSMRRGILPNIIYELIDGLGDDGFDEMCRRLGADRELRSMKSRSNDQLSRGKKYEVLDNIREEISHAGKFCVEIVRLLAIMKEEKLRHSVNEHIHKATMRNTHSALNVEPQSAVFQRLIPVQNCEEEAEEIDYENNTHAKVVN